MIYDYFYIKCVFRWSENSVRYENFMGIDFQKGRNSEILSHSVTVLGMACVWVNLITFRNTDLSEEVDEEDIQSTEGIKVYINF